MTERRLPFLLLALLTGLTVASCDSVTGPTPSSVMVTQAEFQEGFPGNALPDSVFVRVTDENGDPVTGQVVEFTSEQGGQFHPFEAETDLDGLAKTRWILGPFHGMHTAKAAVVGSGLEAAEFRAWANPNRPTYDGPGSDTRVDAANTLEWSVANPTSDEIVFDLYLSTAGDSNLELVSEGQDSTWYNVELATNAKYFWLVVARVSNDLVTYGDTTSVTTAGWSGNRLLPLETIPAGLYTSGEDGHTVNLDYTFEISTLEVTNGVYAMWLNDNIDSEKIRVVGRQVMGYVETGTPWLPDDDYVLLDMTEGNSGRIHWNEANGTFAIDYGYGDHPVNYVTWYGAKAFAADKGLSLATNAEWEKAARGNSGSTYPWGNTGPTCGIVNFDFCYSDTRPAGSFPNYGSHYGISDMAGNVWEWTESFEGTAPIMVPIVRGGGFRSGAANLRAWVKASVQPNDRTPDIGFRVVKLPLGGRD